MRLQFGQWWLRIGISDRWWGFGKKSLYDSRPERADQVTYNSWTLWLPVLRFELWECCW